MFSQDEAMLASRLGMTETEAKEGQGDLNYTHLIDYLATECRQKDRAEFQELMERIENKFRSFTEFQPAWNFLERLSMSVADLEK